MMDAICLLLTRFRSLSGAIRSPRLLHHKTSKAQRKDTSKKPPCLGIFAGQFRLRRQFRSVRSGHVRLASGGCGFLILRQAVSRGRRIGSPASLSKSSSPLERRLTRRAQAHFKSPAMAANWSRAASRSMVISWAMIPGGGRLADSSRASSLSQKMSRFTLSRFSSSS
jgi:hypothetical protein